MHLSEAFRHKIATRARDRGGGRGARRTLEGCFDIGANSRSGRDSIRREGAKSGLLRRASTIARSCSWSEGVRHERQQQQPRRERAQHDSEFEVHSPIVLRGSSVTRVGLHARDIVRGRRRGVGG